MDNDPLLLMVSDTVRATTRANKRHARVNVMTHSADLLDLLHEWRSVVRFTLMSGNAIYTNNDIKIVMVCHLAEEIILPKIVKTEISSTLK